MQRTYLDCFEITKLLIAQANIDREFYGTINRGSDSDGSLVIPDRIKVITGFKCTLLAEDEEIGRMLSEMTPVPNLLCNFKKDKSDKIVMWLSLHLYMVGDKAIK